MKEYVTKAKIIPGSRFKAVEKIALKIFRSIKSQTKRTPHIRSAYFKKEKIFLNIFWSHLHQKNIHDKIQRLRYYECSLDLIQNSKVPPTITPDPHDKLETLYRFTGRTKTGESFFVQIKENKRNKKKYLISIFPKN